MRKDQQDEVTVGNLLKSIMSYQRYDLSQKDPIKWGLDNEETAKDTYIQAMNLEHTNGICNPCGLKLLLGKPYLGATADGIFTCDCHKSKRVVEFKCPYKHREVNVDKAAKTDPTFCIDHEGAIKVDHRYYTQIQLQMLVNGIEVCDFVVYT